MAQTRKWKHWASGEYCWYWRSQGKDGKSRKGRIFRVLARVLLQERELTPEGAKLKGIVWVYDGAALVRVAPAHLIMLTDAEKTLYSLTDIEIGGFQDLVHRLPHSAYLDLVGQPGPEAEAF